MKKTLTLAAGLTAALLSGAAVSAQTAPDAQAPAPLSAARLDISPGLAAFDGAYLEKAQYLFGGRNYCFYLNGWRGPGYYWCGYAYRRGLGWGGPEGWHGWHGGGHGGRGDFARGDRGGMNHGGFAGGHMGGGHMGGGGHEGGGHEGGGHEGGGHEGGGHGGDHHG